MRGTADLRQGARVQRRLDRQHGGRADRVDRGGDRDRRAQRGGDRDERRRRRADGPLGPVRLPQHREDQRAGGLERRLLRPGRGGHPQDPRRPAERARDRRADQQHGPRGGRHGDPLHRRAGRHAPGHAGLGHRHEGDGQAGRGDRRHRPDHQPDRRPHQPAVAQRQHRGGPGRRTRPRLRGGGRGDPGPVRSGRRRQRRRRQDRAGAAEHGARGGHHLGRGGQGRRRGDPPGGRRRQGARPHPAGDRGAGAGRCATSTAQSEDQTQAVRPWPRPPPGSARRPGWWPAPRPSRPAPPRGWPRARSRCAGWPSRPARP